MSSRRSRFFVALVALSDPGMAATRWEPAGIGMSVQATDQRGTVGVGAPEDVQQLASRTEAQRPYDALRDIGRHGSQLVLFGSRLYGLNDGWSGRIA